MQVIQYHTNEGFRTGLLVSTGRKFHKVILMDNPIRIRKVPTSEDRHIKPLAYKTMGQPYPVPRCKRHLRDAARRWHGGLRHVSKEVREALR